MCAYTTWTLILYNTIRTRCVSLERLVPIPCHCVANLMKNETGSTRSLSIPLFYRDYALVQTNTDIRLYFPVHMYTHYVGTKSPTGVTLFCCIARISIYFNVLCCHIVLIVMIRLSSKRWCHFNANELIVHQHRRK